MSPRPGTMTSGVYLIKVKRFDNSFFYYVGSARRIESRFRKHLEKLELGQHENPKMQAVYRHYGPSAFSVRVLEELPDTRKEDRFPVEQRWIEFYLDQYGPDSLLNFEVAGSRERLRTCAEQE